MRIYIRFCLLLCVMIGLNLNLFSQTTPSTVPIELRSMAVDIKAGLFTAVTTIDMEFYNPNARVLDGEYNFSLGAGQVITGFSLDINGFMRAGVIVDKQKGRVAYENVIRRRIDPGLLEMTAGDNYRVRVYPMPAQGTRKIQIVISQRLSIKDNALQYFLPLDIPYRVDNFSSLISVGSAVTTPRVAEGLLSKLSFTKLQDSFLLRHKAKGIKIEKEVLSFAVPLPDVDQLACVSKSGSGMQFALHVKPKLPATAAAFSSVTVFWDVSASAAKRDIKKDIDFLERFLTERKITDLTLVTFSNDIQDTRAWHGRSMINLVRRFLQSQVYDGGTQMGNLDCSKFNTDIFLLFSDGINSFGNDKIKLAGRPVHCINSSSTGNHTALKKIANQSGGNYVDLYTTEINKALKEFEALHHTLLQIQSGGNIAVATSPVSFHDWVTIAGELDESTKQVTLSFGENGRVIKTETLQFNTVAVCSENETSKLLMLQSYERLQLQEDEGAIIASANQHKLVTASTSFIVLDNLNDYIDHGIEPPADLQNEYNKMIYVIKEREQKKKLEEGNALLDNLRKSVTLYNERIKWWGIGEAIDIKQVEHSNDQRLARLRTISEANAGDQQNVNANGESFSKMNYQLSEVIVVGYGTQRRMKSAGSIASISANDISRFGGQNVMQVLQGRIAGVQVVPGNGGAGSAPKIFIRGARALDDAGEALYILDGIPIDAAFVATLNTNDIESISVHKDATATALYGSRAANGAIVITTRRGFRNTNQYKNDIAKYKDLDDVEYVTELKNADKEEMYKNYLGMRNSMEKNQAFYFDIAQLFFESGDKVKAMRILSNLAEMDQENHQLLRAMGYMLESWGSYTEAIEVYTKVLKIKEEEPQSYRDLGLAYEKIGDHQSAVNILYSSLTKNWFQYEDRYRGLKSLMLNEMNSIIAQNQKQLNLSDINGAIIKPLPVDLKIVIDWNKDETDVDLHIVEPGGESCSYNNRFTKSGGRMSEDFTQGYGPEEYQIKEAKKGRYSIQVNYYGDSYQKQQVPAFIKLTIYKNFGRPNQSVSVESIIMDNQTGMIEIGEIKYK